MLFSIGQVTKMYNITHDTLRYYDKINLLKPSIKKENGYRYYTIREIEILEIILIAKQLEIPIKTIKEVLETEDENEYSKLFEKHEDLLYKKIKYLNNLKAKVKKSKEVTHEMSIFENDENLDNLRFEHIDKEIVFLNQNGNSYIGTLGEEKNLMILLSQNENGDIVGDESIIGIEIFKGENFNFDNYTDYVKKRFEGEYIKVTRKDTFNNIEKYIQKVIHKENENKEIHKKIEVLMESMFIISKKNKENIYYTQLYIPKIK